MRKKKRPSLTNTQKSLRKRLKRSFDFKGCATSLGPTLMTKPCDQPCHNQILVEINK